MYSYTEARTMTKHASNDTLILSLFAIVSTSVKGANYCKCRSSLRVIGNKNKQITDNYIM